MTSLNVILSTGRTIQQGIGVEKGKYTDDYSKATSTLLMDPDDMREIGINIGDSVKLKTEDGEIVVRADRSPDAPHRGIIFLPYGPWANALIGENTDSQGMPDSKNVPALVEKTSGPLIPMEGLISGKESD